MFDPTAGTCTSRPYAFHPMYSTSSEHTRVPWASHSYNVSFSDEIGHFENCAAVSREGGRCTSEGSDEGGTGPDGDDRGCFSGATSLLAHVGGCLATDSDFDGASYQRVWPGSTDPRTDAEFHPQAIQWAGPFFNGTHRYARNAFEADLPRIEAADVIDSRFPPCNVRTGANCVNPPPGAAFYPIYTTRHSAFGCEWQLGGVNIPGTDLTFGGTSVTEYGPLLPLLYPTSAGPVNLILNFRRVLDHNPC